MNSKQIFIGTIVVAVVLFLFSLVKDKKSYVISFLFRGVMGVFLMYLINAIFAQVEIPVYVGVNVYTICTSSVLGLPGVFVLYGICGCQLL